MIPILRCEDVRAFDREAIDAGVPSLVLMENAGRGAADLIIEERFARRGDRVVVVCGTGNNGGDGFVVARHLLREGCNVRVFLAGAETKLTGDARHNLAAWRAIGGAIERAAPAILARELRGAALVVDALLGTGLDRPLAGELFAVIQILCASAAPVVALDVPSGLDADTGQPLGIAVKAASTITFAFAKPGHFTTLGAEHTGKLFTVHIGIPSVLDRAADLALLEEVDVARILPKRSLGTHKYSAGHVVVFAGAIGTTGAALLTVRGAQRAGAGAVTLATWDDAAPTTPVLEAMLLSLSRTDARARRDAVRRLLSRAKSVVVGPGFGRDEAAADVVQQILQTCECPLVLDADALFPYAAHPSRIGTGARKAPRILLPHTGELAKLLGTSSAAVDADRFGSVHEAAARTRSVVVHKGAHSLIATTKQTAVNATGNASLATAGAGDVLAGIVGAFACQTDPFAAACAGAWVHGAAADTWSRSHGDRGLLAGEVADGVPDVLARLREAK